MRAIDLEVVDEMPSTRSKKRIPFSSLAIVARVAHIRAEDHKFLAHTCEDPEW